MITEQLNERAYYRSLSCDDAEKSPEQHWLEARNELINERVDRRLIVWQNFTPDQVKVLREKFWMEEHLYVGWLEWVEDHLEKTYLAIEAIEDPTRLDIHVRQQVDRKGETAAISDLLFVGLVLDGSAEYCRHLWRLNAGGNAIKSLVEQKDAKFIRFAQQAVREMGGTLLDYDAREVTDSSLKARRFQDGYVASFGINCDQAVVDALRCAARLRCDLNYCNHSGALGWQDQLHMRAAIATSPSMLSVSLASARQNEIALESKLVRDVASKHPELMRYLVADGLRLVSENFRTSRTAEEE